MNENELNLIASEMVEIAALLGRDDSAERGRGALEIEMEKFEKQLREILKERRERAGQFYEIVLGELKRLMKFIGGSRVLRENPDLRGVREELLRKVTEEVLDPFDAYMERNRKLTDGILRDTADFGKYAEMLKM